MKLVDMLTLNRHDVFQLKDKLLRIIIPHQTLKERVSLIVVKNQITN
jgi:hypothetical protein